MTQRDTPAGVGATGAATEPSTRVTRILLACGVAAGPLYVLLGLVQALTREGFDLRRHELSLLAYGFPPGAPPGLPERASWHGVLHFVTAGLGFVSLIAACLVVAGWFAARRQLGWAAYSVATGVAFFAAFVGIASGSGNQVVNVGFGIAVLLGWAWVSAVATRLTAELADRTR